jgi:colanic acid/amylovoran biosynthesis protein
VIKESQAVSRKSSGLRSVCLLGASLDVGNRGVRALGVSLARLVAKAAPEGEIVLHYGNRSGGSRGIGGSNGTVEVTVRNCRLSPRSNPAEQMLVILGLALLYRIGIRGPARRNPWLRSLLDATFIGDIRGGDSFSDIYGLNRFLAGSLPLLSVALLGRPYTMLPQTYGPFRSRASRILAGRLLKAAGRILTRDRNCESIIRQLSGRSADFCPDVAFTMEAVRPPELPLEPADLDLESQECLVGLNVSGLLYMGGYTGRNMFGLKSEYRDLVDRLVAELLATTSAKILLVPHVFESAEREEEACTAILNAAARQAPGRVFMLAAPLGERELKWVVGRTHFFVGSRMHACIAALSQFVPAVGLAYSDKFLGVFESAGVGDSIIDLRRVEAGEVVKQTLEAFRRHQVLGEVLRARIPRIQQQVFDTFSELLGTK